MQRRTINGTEKLEKNEVERERNMTRRKCSKMGAEYRLYSRSPDGKEAIEEDDALQDLAQSIKRRENELDEVLGKNEDKEKALVNLYLDRRRLLIEQISEEKHNYENEKHGSRPNFQDEYAEYLDSSNRSLEAGQIVMDNFLEEQLRKCKEMQNILERMQLEKLLAAERKLRERQFASAEMAKRVKTNLAEQSRLEREQQRRIAELKLSFAHKADESNLRAQEVEQDEKEHISIDFITEKEMRKERRRSGSIIGEKTDENNRRLLHKTSSTPETLFRQHIQHLNPNNHHKVNRRGRTLETIEFDEEVDEEDARGDDPLMVECVECGNWVVATTHKDQLAIGYCCGNVLVSQIEC